MIAPLLNQLLQYSPWDSTEAAHQTAILNLLQAGPLAFDRQSYEPGHMTGSAWILAEDTGNIALIYHSRLNRWLQPGGHSEPGETDGLSTALREVREELGLVIDPSKAQLFDLDVHRIPRTTTQPSHLHFDLRYLCLTQQQRLVSDSDAAQARWFTVAKLEAMQLEESMQRMLAKGMKQASADGTADGTAHSAG
jgi:8-oxo-dGTP pyrophosphatase MutT (NUDIX family)